jgi:hypothetical protein
MKFIWERPLKYLVSESAAIWYRKLIFCAIKSIIFVLQPANFRPSDETRSLFAGCSELLHTLGGGDTWVWGKGEMVDRNQTETGWGKDLLQSHFIQYESHMKSLAFEPVTQGLLNAHRYFWIRIPSFVTADPSFGA